jgi:hypothetical protein
MSEEARSDSLDVPPDTLWERADESPLRVRSLVSLDRWLVVAAFSVLGYGLLVLFALVGPNTVEPMVTGNAMSSVFGSIIIAVVTSVTLVLTVAQLVLSEQIEELKAQQEILQGEVDFRQGVEELRGIGVSPVKPNEFFRLLLAMVATRAERVADALEDAGRDGEFPEVMTYTEAVLEDSRESMDDLEDAEFGSFDVLLPMLHYNYPWKIHAARSLMYRYADELPEDAVDGLDELIQVLRRFAPTREYFKSHYFQWQIINTARSTLHGAMPALAVAAYMILAFDPTGINGRILGVSRLYLLVSATYVVVLLPFTVLLAYLLRILTVVKRTLDIGPFILRETEADKVTDTVE